MTNDASTRGPNAHGQGLTLDIAAGAMAMAPGA
jgi:hypothetical protein